VATKSKNGAALAAMRPKAFDHMITERGDEFGLDLQAAPADHRENRSPPLSKQLRFCQAIPAICASK